MNALELIVESRRESIRSRGHAQGITLPGSRQAPLVPFASASMPICEIKRRSPSRDRIADIPSAKALAARYAASGIGRVSVLTEETHFGGSLADLAEVKSSLPGLAVLRKDFILDAEDVRTSFLAGADAILLIAAMHDGRTLASLHETAAGLGMECLVELHDEADMAKARAFRPPLVGINSRNLATLAIEPMLPLRLRPLVDWPCRVVYESGIRNASGAALATGTGFDGALAGEAAAQDPAFAGILAAAFGGGRDSARRKYGYLQKLYARKRPGRPLSKVCGITDASDAMAAADSGADALGFVFAPGSPRRADPRAVAAMKDLGLTRIGVVVLEPGGRPGSEIEDLLRDGKLDAIQFHGSETEAEMAPYPGYKAVPASGPDAFERAGGTAWPVALVDASVKGKSGGLGARIDPELVDALARGRELWLAGGLGPENVAEAAARHRPALVDASSRLESSPGRKDRAAMAEYHRRLDHGID